MHQQNKSRKTISNIIEVSKKGQMSNFTKTFEPIFYNFWKVAKFIILGDFFCHVFIWNLSKFRFSFLGKIGFEKCPDIGTLFQSCFYWRRYFSFYHGAPGRSCAKNWRNCTIEYSYTSFRFCHGTPNRSCNQRSYNCNF